MNTSARALLEALSAAGVTLRANGATALFAKPSSAVPAAVIPLLKRFKVELLQALWHRREQVLRACSACDLDFVSGTDALCPGCKLTEFNSVTPNSRQEVDYLKRQSAPN